MTPASAPECSCLPVNALLIRDVSLDLALQLKGMAHSLGAQAAFVGEGVRDAAALILGPLFLFEQLGEMAAGSWPQEDIGPLIKQAEKNYQRTEFTVQAGKYTLSLGRRTSIMGILNITPDSFSDGGRYLEPGLAVERAHRMVAAGADIIDIGGESSRPGSAPVSAEEELSRICPVLKALLAELEAPISIDTYKAEVAREALGLGAHMINDISALRLSPDLGVVVGEYGVPLILMHMQGTPRNMQQAPCYVSLLDEVITYLAKAIERAAACGVKPEQIIIDPGLGFGKTLGHNLQLLHRLDELKCLGKPILVGPSRKSFVGQALSLPVNEREEGTAAAVGYGILRGAHIVRVHEVEKMSRLTRMLNAIAQSRHAA